MVKVAYIGGGSLFVPSIINGIAKAQLQREEQFDVEMALYDPNLAAAEVNFAYGEVVRKAWGVPLRMRIATERGEALDGAEVVVVSAWLEQEHAQIDALWSRLGFKLPEEGPAVVAWGAALLPWSLGLAEEMRRYCPGGLFLTLMNPTDVLAGAVQRLGGVRAAGMCVEVDGLRGALGYYFRTPVESIRLDHAGVNHDGWVLRIDVNGEDGYSMWQNRWEEIERDADFHPGNRGMAAQIRLMGRLKSSGYHHWPLQIDQSEELKQRWQLWQGKREMYRAAVGEAIRRGKPIRDAGGIHPERSKLNYPITGESFGRMLRGMALVLPERLPLMVENHGAVENFPEAAIVEVPVIVQGQTLTARRVGVLSETIGGYTRLLAIQRERMIDYLCQREIGILKEALSALPLFGSLQQQRAFVEAIHETLLPGLGG